MTKEGDVVLVYMDDNPAFFARVEGITIDMKPGWFHLRLLVLQMPLLVVTWILRESYFNGEEFTMGGHPMRIEKVIAPSEETGEGEDEPRVLTRQPPPKPEPAKPSKAQKVISMVDRRKKNGD
ncbi:MAG: hypothetical protein LLG06_00180 [Desulfobacteraceae bacterium]|nr:hypothetical protein [Desulfobacteraceae bacterium]